MNNTILIGTDPELFLLDQQGKIVSAIGLVGGSKESPRLISYGAVQEDNVLAEFNTDPAASADDFIRNIHEVTRQLSDIIHPMTLDYRSSHWYTRAQLMSYGTAAMTMGCEPDYNCWTGEVNDKPSPYTELRTAGGHIHVGYPDPTEEASRTLACVMEYTLGLASVCMDDDTDRRGLYGASGAYRTKPYGVEYRVLSNFWLRSEELQRWAYQQAYDSVALMDTLHVYTDAISPDEVARIINTSDRESAICAVNQLGIHKL